MDPMRPGQVLSAAQCPRRRWLDVHLERTSAASRAAAANAQSLRRALQQGVSSATEGWSERDEPVCNAQVTALGVTVRADLLEPHPDGGWTLCRFRASTRRKPWHVDDLAVQTLVLRAAGIEVRAVQLWRLDRRQRRRADLDVRSLMRRDDRTAQVEVRLEEIARFLNGLGPLPESEPTTKTGPHCSRPRRCPHVVRCGGRPKEGIRRIPRGGHLHAQLAARGITEWQDIPDDLPRTGLQDRVLTALRTGQPVVDRSLVEDLAADTAHFLDFEAWSPAIPPVAGLAPYDAIIVQWSLHSLDGDGLRHREGLGDSSDPRRELAASLAAALDEPGPIFVFGEFEARALGLLGQHEPRLLDARDRLVDLLPLLRRKYVHPEFRGFGLKQVFPVLCPGEGYDDVELDGGGEAPLAYAELISPETTPGRRAELRGQLLEYCQRDTLALVRVREALLAAVRSSA